MRALVQILSVALLGFVITGCGKLEEYPTTESAFRATFGKAPPAQITSLQAYGKTFRDSAHCYLRFNAPLALVQSLAGGSFSEISAVSFASNTCNAAIFGPTPLWWAPSTNSTSKFYSSSGFHPSFSQGKAFLAYDATSQIAHFYWDGLD